MVVVVWCVAVWYEGIWGVKEGEHGKSRSKEGAQSSLLVCEGLGVENYRLPVASLASPERTHEAPKPRTHETTHTKQSSP